MSAYDPELIEEANSIDDTAYLEDSALLKVLKAENAATRKWVDEHPGSCAGYLSEDLKHWHELGVYIPADFERYMLVNQISDSFKEANGFRPRHWNFDELSLEQLRAILNEIITDINEQQKFEDSDPVNDWETEAFFNNL